ncbi:MAG: TonB-dependent receptor plug domain-containing protein, partial [Bacteroidota bacterium]
MKHFLVLLLAFFSLKLVTAQTVGHVYHANDSTPLSGVHVISSSNLVAVTDNKGKFQFDTTLNKEAIIKHVGFLPDTVMLRDSADNYLFLHPVSEGLSGVTVTSWGYFNDYRHQLSHVSELNPDKIGESAVVNPVESLYRKSGIEFQRGARNTQKITIRGAGARSMYSTTRTNVFFNGIPLSSALGEVFLDDLLWNETHEVSIIKGAVPPVFGSAAGGVVLLRKNQPGDASRVSSGVTAGSAGYMHHYYNTQLQANRFSADIQYQDISEDGFRENSSYRGKRVSALLTFRLNENHRLQSFTLISDMKGFIPSSLSYDDFRNNPVAAGGNWKETSGYEKNESGAQGVTLHSRYSEKLSHETTLYGFYRNGNERRPFNTLNDQHRRTGLRSVLTAEVGHDLPGQWLWQAGGKYQYGDYSWKTLETLDYNQTGELLTDQSQNRQEAEGFLFTSYTYQNWKAEAGIHVNQTQYHTENDLNSDN